MKNILVIGAHPDDETLGAGGTILKNVAAGNKVYVLILTDGVSSRHNEKAQQINALENACKVLGVERLYVESFLDQKLDEPTLLEVIRAITKVIDEIRPEIVYTHHGGDTNQDHRVIFEATMVAVRPFGNNPVKELYTYETASSTEWAPPLSHWAFLPNTYENIEEFINKKIEAFSVYSDTFFPEVREFPHPRSLEAIKIYAQKRGVEVGMLYAEAFQLIRKLR